MRCVQTQGWFQQDHVAFVKDAMLVLKFADKFAVGECALELLHNPRDHDVRIAVVGMRAKVVPVWHPVRVVQYLVQQ